MRKSTMNGRIVVQDGGCSLGHSGRLAKARLARMFVL